MKRIKSVFLSLLIVSAVLFSFPAQAAAEGSDGSDMLICKRAYNYTDVSGSWCESSVLSYGYDYIFSDGSGLFHPDRPVTRMEFVRLLHEALGISVNYISEPDIGDYFDDVSNSDAGAGDLYDLVSCGIVDKTGSFNPSGTIERDEMAHYIINAFGHFVNGVYSMPAIMVNAFDDSTEADSAYRADIDEAAALGLLNGKGGNLFCPNDTVTRAEAVTAAARLALKVTGLDNTEVYVRTSAYAEENGALSLSLDIINDSDNTVTITSNTLQKYDFAFFDENGKELYRWSDGRMFGMVVTSTDIEPGEEEVYTETIDADTYSSIKSSTDSIRAYITGSTEDFEMASDGYSIQVPENNG